MNKILAGILLLSLFSCVSPRKIHRDGYLLNKSAVKTDNNSLSLDEITGFIQPQPNKKLLGVFRLNSWIYEHSKWKWFKSKFGQPPVILDTSLANNSRKQIALYMASKGYFYAQVGKEIKYRRKNANITYHIKSGEPYTLRNVSYDIGNEQLKIFFLADTSNSLVKPGSNYDAYAFDDERTRITNLFRNHGYYYFSREFIFFNADSSLSTKQMDIAIEIRNPIMRNQATGAVTGQKHIRYKINHINFNTDLRLTTDDYQAPDTLVLPQYPGDTTKPFLYRYIYLQKLRLSPYLLNRQIFTKGGEFYRLDNFNVTYSRLSNLAITKFININFEPLATTDVEGNGLLDCNIQIGRSNAQVFTIETGGTNTGGFLGIGSNFMYSNRNLFRGGEVFSIKLKGALEMQRTISGQENLFLGFNTLETGIEARLEFPRLLAPTVSKQFSRYSSPKTTLNSGLNFQRRPDYTRYIANLSFGYEWRDTITRSHVFVPLELNSVRIFTSNEFATWLNGLTDKRLKNQYTDHLVPLMRYVFVFNNQSVRKNRDFMVWRTSIENGGALINVIDRAFGAPKNELGNYTLMGIRYAQFVRAETDFRYYKVLSPVSNIVFRFAAGAGKPYGNSDALPVEKGFYAGGSNGMRGWEIRSLGPGRFNDPENSFDRMGEMWLESNIEFRFPIYSWLNGALFADAGNIWMLKENVDIPGGAFKASELPDHVAIDGGLGIRFDFSFFILRIDGAVKLKNPTLVPGNQWLKVSDLGIRKVVWNFGIGYPF